MYQEYSRSERLADSFVHAVGLCAGVVAVGVMIVSASFSLPQDAIVSLAIYGAALLAMLGCSAAYNLLPTTEWRMRFRRFDQAAIFIKIAATYTPFAAIKVGGVTGAVFLATVWSVALLGSAIKILELHTRDAFDIALYLILGWAGLFIIVPLSSAVGTPVLTLLAAGGILYSVGVVFHLSSRMKYHNVVWHGFVLAGTCCHFGAVNAALFG